MEAWLALGILAYFSFSLSSILDKVVSKNHHSFLFSATKLGLDGVVMFLFGFFFGSLSFSWTIIPIVLLLGGLYGAAAVCYFKAMEKKEADEVITYCQLYIPITALSVAFLFDEPLSVGNVIGIFCIVFGSMTMISKGRLLSLKKDKGTTYLWMQILFASIYFILVKKFVANVEPITLGMSMYFASSALLFLYMFWKGIHPRLRDIPKTLPLAAVFAGMGMVFLLTALSVGYGSKVYSLGGIQAVSAFFLAMLFLKEKFTWHHALGTIFVFCGIYLVSL